MHVLLIPKRQIPRLADATESERAILGHLMLVAGDISRQLGVDEAFKARSMREVHNRGGPHVP